MSTRQRIVDALAQVPGITATLAPPDVGGPGAAWPTWTGAAVGTYCALIDTWWVYVILPNPTKLTTVEASDPLIQAVWSALLDVGDVSACDTARISDADPADSTALPALRFTMTTTGMGARTP
jgi:hypothetical protein